MKNHLFLLSGILVLATACGFGQKNRVFQPAVLNDSTTLVGVCPFYDQQQVLKNYAFYIDKKDVLTRVSKSLTHGDKVLAGEIDDELNILVVKDKEVQPIQIAASPKHKYINIEDDFFSFDASQLQSLARSYPLNYTTKIMKFTRQDEYDAFMNKYKPDPSFLCFEDVTEEPEGVCTITVKVEGQDQPAIKGLNLIEADLQGLGAQKLEDYLISYTSPAGAPGQYKYEVQLNKKFYDGLSNPAFTKGAWILNAKEIITYWSK